MYLNYVRAVQEFVGTNLAGSSSRSPWKGRPFTLGTVGLPGGVGITP